jgi:hypothetical protein
MKLSLNRGWLEQINNRCNITVAFVFRVRLGYLTMLFYCISYMPTASNERIILNNELEIFWKEAVVTYFKILYYYHHLSRVTEEKKPAQAIYGARIEPETSRLRRRSAKNPNVCEFAVNTAVIGPISVSPPPAASINSHCWRKRTQVVFVFVFRYGRTRDNGSSASVSSAVILCPRTKLVRHDCSNPE